MKQKGFTLLELLVVIGIIGILVSLITVSFSNAQKSSRDSRRRQDIVAIQNAMEQYYSQNEFEYPVCTGISCGTLASYFVNSTAPTDPLNSTVNGVTYQYTYASSISQYSVTANLEKCPAAPDPCNVTVTNLQ